MPRFRLSTLLLSPLVLSPTFIAAAFAVDSVHGRLQRHQYRNDSALGFPLLLGLPATRLPSSESEESQRLTIRLDTVSRSVCTAGPRTEYRSFWYTLPQSSLTLGFPPTNLIVGTTIFVLLRRICRHRSDDGPPGRNGG